MGNEPFFIIGCIRSGTTLLRDVLRKHPNIASPEETHFYRWPDPFGTALSFRYLQSNVVLKKHRELDGITEAEFQDMLHSSFSRSELTMRYMQRYIEKNKPEATRWADKTPQNVYGAAMIAQEFPGAKFLHIVRDPLDVVSSLRIGVIVKIENIVGACNYWNESAEIIDVLKLAYPDRVYELKYEEFTKNFLPEVKKVLDFIGEDHRPEYFEGIVMNPKHHKDEGLFTPEELNLIEKLCGRWAKQYGYDLHARDRKTTTPAEGLP